MSDNQLTSQSDERKDLFIFARFHAREGQEGAVAATLRDEIIASRTESGCLAHQAYRSTRDPKLFFIHSRWIDQAAFETHVQMSHTKRFAESIQPLIDHELDVTRARPISAPEQKRREDNSARYFLVTREHGPAWNRTRQMREQEAWAEHAEFMNGLADEGFIVLCGPLGDDSKALHVVRADSEGAIERRFEADPWAKRGLLLCKIESWEILLR